MVTLEPVNPDRTHVLVDISIIQRRYISHSTIHGWSGTPPSTAPKPNKMAWGNVILCYIGNDITEDQNNRTAPKRQYDGSVQVRRPHDAKTGRRKGCRCSPRHGRNKSAYQAIRQCGESLLCRQKSSQPEYRTSGAEALGCGRKKSKQAY